MSNPKIVVIGAGFAGVAATKKLAKRLKEAEITLIDKHSYHTMMTQLHEVAAGRVPFTNAQYDLQKLFAHAKNVKLITDSVVNLDKTKKQVITAENGSFDYDYVVVAIGGEPNDFGVPGVKEHGLTLWSMEDALRIKAHLTRVAEMASLEHDEDKRRALLNIVVAGSGFTGIEMVGELIDWREVTARDYKLDINEIQLNVVEMMPTILNTLDRPDADKVLKYLTKRGVNVLTEHAIAEVASDHVVIKDKEAIPTHTLIWTTGVQGNTQAAAYELQETERGHRLQANAYMEAVGFEGQGIYVAGDVSGFIEATGRPTPQIVEAAEQTAHTATENIIVTLKGGEKEQYHGKYQGTMVSVGSKWGVASLMGKLHLSGFFAMAVKHLIYVLYTLQIGSAYYLFTYLKNEIFHTPNERNLFRGHTSRLGNVLWSVPLRLFYGLVWLLDAAPKVFGNSDQSWMGDKIKMSFVLDSAGGWIKTASDAAAGASSIGDGGETAKAATHFSLSYLQEYTPAPTADGVVPFLKPILKIMMPNQDVVLFMQKAMSILELLLALAIIAGAFTFIASAATAGLVVMFSLTGFFYWVNIWFIFVAIALMNGSGRSFGLDKWIQPFIQKHLGKWWYGKSKSIYK